jgi:hypothetical protein
MSDERIFPAELIALIIFLFLPPLLISSVAQAIYIFKRGIFKSNPRVATATILITLLTVITSGAGLLLSSPNFLPRWLGVIDIYIGGAWLPILPLSFILAATATPLITALAIRNHVA